MSLVKVFYSQKLPICPLATPRQNLQRSKKSWKRSIFQKRLKRSMTKTKDQERKFSERILRNSNLRLWRLKVGRRNTTQSMTCLTLWFQKNGTFEILMAMTLQELFVTNLNVEVVLLSALFKLSKQGWNSSMLSEEVNLKVFLLSISCSATTLMKDATVVGPF